MGFDGGDIRRVGLVALEIEVEAGADADFGAHENVAASLLDNAVAGGEAKARAGANFLGGEERLENAFDDFGAHAGAGVAHLDEDVVPGEDHVVLRRGDEVARHRIR